MIYPKVENLKDERNEDGKKYFINDQLPTGLNEKRRRVQQMKKEKNYRTKRFQSVNVKTLS